jgi:hypothetical protein
MGLVQPGGQLLGCPLPTYRRAAAAAGDLGGADSDFKAAIDAADPGSRERKFATDSRRWQAACIAVQCGVLPWQHCPAGMRQHLCYGASTVWAAPALSPLPLAQQAGGAPGGNEERAACKGEGAPAQSAQVRGVGRTNFTAWPLAMALPSCFCNSSNATTNCFTSCS